MVARWALTKWLMGAGLALGVAIGAGCQPEGGNGSSSPAGVGGNGSEAAADNPLLAMTDTTRVTIKGETFTVAIADEGSEREKGLGGVPEIPADRGMLFVFPRRQYLNFVMRDCLVPIDIAYLTSQGMIGKMYTMAVEPRDEGEGARAYEQRLTKYPSDFPAQMVLEFRAGTLERLGVSVGDKVEIEDLEGLKRRAK